MIAIESDAAFSFASLEQAYTDSTLVRLDVATLRLPPKC